MVIMAPTTPSLKQSTPSSAIRKARKIRKHATQISNSWLTAYGLQFFSRDSSSGKIHVVGCKFCSAFGLEKVDRRTKNSRPQNILNTRKCGDGFRSDNFTSYMVYQHATRWEKDVEWSDADKNKFFVVENPFTDTITAHFGCH